RHPAVDGVEPVGSAQEVGGALARASNARQLDYAPRIDAHVIERVDDALRNRVVPAACAQRGLAALVDLRFQPDSIDSYSHIVSMRFQISDFRFQIATYTVTRPRSSLPNCRRAHFSLPPRSLPGPAHRR